MDEKHISSVLKAVIHSQYSQYQELFKSIPLQTRLSALLDPIPYEQFEQLHASLATPLSDVFSGRFNFYREKQPKGMCLLGYLVIRLWFLEGEMKEDDETRRMLHSSITMLEESYRRIPKEVFYLCSICPINGELLVALILSNRLIIWKRQHTSVPSHPAYAGGLEDPPVCEMFLEILRGYHDGIQLFEKDPEEWKTKHCTCRTEEHDSHSFTLLLTMLSVATYPLNLRLYHFFRKHSDYLDAQAKSRLESDLSTVEGAFSDTYIKRTYLPYTIERKKVINPNLYKLVNMGRLPSLTDFETAVKHMERLKATDEIELMLKDWNSKTFDIMISAEDGKQAFMQEMGTNVTTFCRTHDSADEQQEYIMERLRKIRYLYCPMSDDSPWCECL